MSRTSPDHLMIALETLLDRERKALQIGNLSEFDTIIKDKEALINNAVNSRPPTPMILSRIQKKAQQNQQLLTSAIRAIKSVKEHLAILNTDTRIFETYAKSGKRREIGGSRNPEFELRA